MSITLSKKTMTSRPKVTCSCAPAENENDQYCIENSR